MTKQTDDLIVEAREPLRHTGDDHCSVCYGSCGAWHGERVGDMEDLIGRLADALEAAEARAVEAEARLGGIPELVADLESEADRMEAERDAALAVIENVREAVSHAMHPEQDQGRCGVCRVERILSSVPADVLRERDAEKWDQGARHVYAEGGKCLFARDGDPCPYNPYRIEQNSEGNET